MTVTADELPPGLVAQAELGPEWADWLDRLPRLASDLLGDWDLGRDGATLWHGFESLVIPVRDSAGGEAVLKVAFDGDDEGVHEALGLQHWGGRGAVTLMRADPRRRALLLERLERHDLTGVDDLEACTVVGELYGRLHIPAPRRLATLTSYVQRWIDALADVPRDAPIPRRLVEQALSLGGDLVADASSIGVMIHGDLHHENVLRRGGSEWVIIDPKPLSGDAHYEPAPMLWNHLDTHGRRDVREVVRARFHTIVDGAGLDPDRARDWVIVRMILNAHRAIEDAERMSRALTSSEREWITTCIAVAKAVMD